MNPPTPTPSSTPSAALAEYSRFVQRIRRRYASELALLPPGAVTLDTLRHTYDALRAQGHDVGAALRVLRQLVQERLVVLDVEARESLAVITGGVTALAEFALDVACQQTFDELDARHGAPLNANGQRCPLWVIGMGKFGARELNVSSDIDLIYIFDDDGDTAGLPDGRGRISNQEYFTRAVKRMYTLIGETTEHGFVFRVDLALRPNGNSGPSAVSLAALEEYLMVQGREWERFAWLKSRVVAPRSTITDGSAQAMRGVVLPFVFRRYLDYNVFESLRVLHGQIRDHANKRSAGHPERANDVKLSRGGIREIEFTVQLLQVVRGGQFPELRTRPTLDALQRVTQAGLMAPATADALATAYVFLRQVEHRIQYLDDQQTHILPTREDDLAWIAHSMGFAGTPSFLAQLAAHRDLVAAEFDVLLGGAHAPDAPAPSPDATAGEAAELVNVDALQQQIDDWLAGDRVTALREESQARLQRLMQRGLQWRREGRTTDEALRRMMDWVEPLLRRDSYLALLWERPAVHERLLRLLGAARWPAHYMRRHPGVIDELAGATLLHDRFDATAFERDLEARRTALSRTGEDDEENLLNLLRRTHHAEVFRTLARDVEGAMTVEQVADDLSALADAVLRVTLRWCWERLKKRHLPADVVPPLAIIAYGKLGGKELGYGSDLDIVFVHDDPHEDAPEVYAALVRKLITWLTVKTGEGDLYEIDTALRPNGSAGLLVSTFDAYADYQQQRGSNTAWTWEHQAMTRARAVLGPPDLMARFDAVRCAVITAPRDLAALRGEIIAMRERVRQAHPVAAGQYDVKHSEGAMMDVEFVVQDLVLAHAKDHPPLQGNWGNIGLLERAEAAGLLPAGMGHAAADAYRALRQVQHRARLDEAPTSGPLAQFQTERDAILALWRHVLG